jgi:phosphoserine phosphatase
MDETRRIAVFCDVDEVLTETPVNMQLATLLKVDDHLEKIEEAFYRDGSTVAFNQGFIPLFRGAGFNKLKAKEYFNHVELRNRAEELISLEGVDIHLVTSGPSFYLDILANRHGLDVETRCKCSRYEFDDDGTLSSTGWVAAGAAAKKSFVKRCAKDYALTVGVGNHVVLDGPFLALCSIPVLVGELEKGFLCVNELDPVIDVIADLVEWTEVRR